MIEPTRGGGGAGSDIGGVGGRTVTVQAKGWAPCTLADVVTLKTGPFGSAVHQSDYVNGGTPLINPTHIKSGTLVPDFSVTVTLEKLTELNEYKLVEGDVVMGRRGEMGRCAVAPKTAEGWLCGTGSVIARPTNAITPHFLQRFLSSPETVRALNGDSVGSTMVNLNQKILLSLSIDLPPLAEQKRIADKLDTVLTRVDAVNTRLARVAPLLKRFRQSVLAAATSGRLTEDWRGGRAVNETWRVIPLGKYVENHDGARVPISETLRTERRGAYPYYGASGVIDTIDGFTHEGKFVLIGEDGANLVTRSKPIAFIATGKIWVNNHAHVLKCKEGASDEYLAYYINSIDLTPYVSGSAQPKLNQKNLNTIPVPVPPTEEQTEIVRRVETLFAFADRLEARLAQAQTAATRLTPALLAKAFRGELVPQDPNDEPAAELLRRLQAERATAAPAGRTGAGRGRGRKALAAPVVAAD